MHQTKRIVLKENTLKDTVRCYSHENAITTDNGATIKEDTRLSRQFQHNRATIDNGARFNPGHILFISIADFAEIKEHVRTTIPII
jgi:hypothetical protein